MSLVGVLCSFMPAAAGAADLPRTEPIQLKAGVPVGPDVEVGKAPTGVLAADPAAAYRANRPTPAWPFPALDDLKPRPDPDPLIFLDGRPVRTAEDWQARRREIVRLADHYIFGSVPPERLKAGTPEPEAVETDANAHDGLAVLKTLHVYLAPDGKQPGSDSVIYGKGPMAFLLREGDHTWLLDDWKYLADYADERLKRHK